MRGVYEGSYGESRGAGWVWAPKKQTGPLIGSPWCRTFVRSDGSLPLPVGNEQVRFGRLIVVAIGRPHDLLAVGGEHREPIEHW